ncbi:Para-hydroxybenzoate--polyprenyltransferase, mitochondrial precursor (PHB:polyprenyltransferase) [Homalodisca vitripennis]|nr:Para-hydroxybenzoate--polyprenyltransferase, mitochondrial precursor (PHB:polyprenyltransferase) [Homalodisca vitripennis]
MISIYRIRSMHHLYKPFFYDSHKCLLFGRYSRILNFNNELNSSMLIYTDKRIEGRSSLTDKQYKYCKYRPRTSSSQLNINCICSSQCRCTSTNIKSSFVSILLSDRKKFLEKFSAVRLVDSSSDSIKPYLKLMRIDRPIGTWLLFWPCGWSIGMAAVPSCLPPLDLLTLFAVGAFIMRGAGCTINDMWDKDIDGKVARTKDRPLVSGALSQWDVLVFLSGQLYSSTISSAIVAQTKDRLLVSGALSQCSSVDSFTRQQFRVVRTKDRPLVSGALSQWDVLVFLSGQLYSSTISSAIVARTKDRPLVSGALSQWDVLVFLSGQLYSSTISSAVARTKDRPLVSGALSQWDALVFLSGQLYSSTISSAIVAQTKDRLLVSGALSQCSSVDSFTRQQFRVARTKDRPLVSGALSQWDALVFLSGQLYSSKISSAIVARTKDRPLVSGALSQWDALVFLSGQLYSSTFECYSTVLDVMLSGGSD